MMERLDKWLCDRLPDSRKEIKQKIRAGQVRVNGSRVTDSGMHISDTDEVSLCGVVVSAAAHLYIMLHKPKGVVSVSSAPGDRTVIDLLPQELRRNGLFPAGRLDRDTTGFVLITDDGEFAHRILSPKRHVTKTYTAVLRDPAEETYPEAFESGIVLGDGTKCLSATLQYTDDPRRVIVQLREGRYHQVKRMFASLGNHVQELHRDAIGGVSLDAALKPGEARLLRADEIERIQMQTVE